MGLRPTDGDESRVFRRLIPNGLGVTFDGVLLMFCRLRRLCTRGLAPRWEEPPNATSLGLAGAISGIGMR